MGANAISILGATMRKCVIGLVFLLSSSSVFGQQYDILIRNGRVVDGMGNPWVYVDVGVTGDRISLVGRAPANATVKQVIDAKGLIVAPGFIDMLEQSEWNLLIDKQAFSKLTQGITTGITGEGGSIAPQNDEALADRRDFLEHYHLAVDWRDLDGYFRRLEKQGAGINLGTYVGATQVRRCVMGSADRAPTFYAKTEELIALAKVASKYGGIYASHIRNEGDHEMEALDEAFRIGREAKIPVEIWHLKVAGRQNWGK